MLISQYFPLVILQICGREELDLHQPERDARGRPADAVLCLGGDGNENRGGVRGAGLPGGGHGQPPDGEQPAEVRPQEGGAQIHRPHVR